MKMMKPHTLCLVFCLLSSLFLNAQAHIFTLVDTTIANKLLKESNDLNTQWKCEEAFLKIDSALAIYIQLLGDSSKETANVFFQRGFINLSVIKYENALHDFQTSLIIRQKQLNEMSREVAFSYNAIGIVYYEKGDNSLALSYFEKAMKIRVQLFGNKHPDVASSFNNVANCYADRGDTDTAIPYFEKALAIQINAIGDNNLKTALFLKNIGRCYFDKGDYEKALFFHQKALKIRLGLLGELHSDIAVSYYNIGNCYEFKNDYEKALNYYNKALQIMLKTAGELDPNTAMAYGNIGNAYLFLKEYDIAIKFQKKALDIRLKIFGEKHRNVATNLAALGLTYLEKGDYSQSIECYNKCKALAVQIFGKGSTDEANTYLGLGLVSMKSDKFQAALSYFDEFYGIMSKKLGAKSPYVSQVLMLKGECYYALKDFDNAISMFEKSISFNQYAFDLNFSNVKSVSYLIETLSEMGKVYNNSSFSNINREKSLDYYKQALKAIGYLNNNLTTDGGKIFVKNKNYQTYEGAIQSNLLLDNENLVKETFDYVEQSKASNLFAHIKETNALHFAGVTDSLLQYEYHLRSDITWRDKQRQEKLNAGKSETDSSVLDISSKLFDLRQQYDSLKTYFEKNYPDYYRLKYDLATVPLSTIQQKMLSSNQTLLSYFVGDSSIYAFVVRKDTFVVVDIKKDFPLESWVRQLRDGLYGYHTAEVKTEKLYEMKADSFVDASTKLYDKIIAPLSKILTKELVIVPDGVLGYVPFDVLLTEKPKEATDFNKHNYFGKEKIISYNYSATLWQEMRAKKHKTEPTKRFVGYAPYFEGDTSQFALQFGDDIAMRTGLNPLPNTGEEVYKSQKLMKGESFIGKTATKAQFTETAGNYRILHLATHGKANDKIGDYCFLAFTEQKDSLDNELLYVRDIYNLSLNADLVVLSACETGIGELKRGEGIISLARAFAYAGAKSILTTLWRVNDKSTLQIMEGFYRHLKNGQAKDRALWQAKLDYLNKAKNLAAHPYYWSAFIPIGDMGRVKN